MSTIVYGALSRAREQKSGTSDPVQTSTYIDALAALIPAEVLALHALLMTGVANQKTTQTTITVTLTQKHQMKVAFLILILLSVLMYFFSHYSTNWDRLDFLRMLIPPASFVAWCLIQRTSVWDAIKPGMDFGWRQFIGAVAAVALGGLSLALAGKANEKRTPKAVAVA
jgi:hypothetical protein